MPFFHALSLCSNYYSSKAKQRSKLSLTLCDGLMRYLRICCAMLLPVRASAVPTLTLELLPHDSSEATGLVATQYNVLPAEAWSETMMVCAWQSFRMPTDAQKEIDAIGYPQCRIHSSGTFVHPGSAAGSYAIHSVILPRSAATLDATTFLSDPVSVRYSLNEQHIIDAVTVDYGKSIELRHLASDTLLIALSEQCNPASCTAQLAALRSHDLWTTRYERAISDLQPSDSYPHFCCGFNEPLHASSNSIEKAWSVMLAESVLDANISDMTTILEIGSGNGQRPHAKRLLWSTWPLQPLPEPTAFTIIASEVQFTHWFIIGDVTMKECSAIREAAESMLVNDTILWLENRVSNIMHTAKESRWLAGVRHDSQAIPSVSTASRNTRNYEVKQNLVNTVSTTTTTAAAAAATAAATATAAPFNMLLKPLTHLQSISVYEVGCNFAVETVHSTIDYPASVKVCFWLEYITTSSELVVNEAQCTDSMSGSAVFPVTAAARIYTLKGVVVHKDASVIKASVQLSATATIQVQAAACEIEVCSYASLSSTLASCIKNAGTTANATIIVAQRAVDIQGSFMSQVSSDNYSTGAKQFSSDTNSAENSCNMSSLTALYTVSCPNNLVQSAATIITAYFRMASKRSEDEYISWMANMLSLNTSMVIYIDTELTELIEQLRSKYSQQTVIVPTTLAAFRTLACGLQYWEAQRELDCEGHIHTAPLYAIWAEKSNMVNVAADSNCFNSSHFFWVDIGYYRENHSADYYSQPIPSPLLLQHMRSGSMLFTAINRPALDDIATNGPYDAATQSTSTRRLSRGVGQIRECLLVTIGGGFFGGDHKAIIQWNRHYYAAVDRYVDEGWFAGKDQMVFTTVCIERKGLCQMFDSRGQWFAGQQLLSGLVSLNDNYYFP
eukprot:3277-Heterococcus_DN1.PRE.1